jgi:uncharacterized protein (TIGR02453 family)
MPRRPAVSPLDSPPFEGFPASALSFFRKLKAHNDRDWFAVRKPVFIRDLHEPMLALISRLRDQLQPDLPDYVFEPKRAVYRIYRDTRFSKDKTPYKLHYGAQFQHAKVTKNLGAGLYFHVSATEVAIGGGLYMPGPDELLAVRLAMVRHEKQFRALLIDKSAIRLLGPVAGDVAARVPKLLEGAPERTHDLVRRKQVYHYLELDAKLATTPGLEREIVRRFRAAMPLVSWINDVLVEAIARQAGEDAKPRRPEPMF